MWRPCNGGPYLEILKNKKRQQDVTFIYNHPIKCTARKSISITLKKRGYSPNFLVGSAQLTELAEKKNWH